MKKSSSYENSVGCRFDYFCKKVLKGERIDYERHLAYRRKHEVMLSELSEKTLSQLYTIDEYDMENDCFQVLGYDITVKDDLIAEALQALTEKKRNVILLSYFMDMNDTEIAKEMNLVCSPGFIKKGNGGKYRWKKRMSVRKNRNCCLAM